MEIFRFVVYLVPRRFYVDFSLQTYCLCAGVTTAKY